MLISDPILSLWFFGDMIEVRGALVVQIRLLNKSAAQCWQIVCVHTTHRKRARALTRCLTSAWQWNMGDTTTTVAATKLSKSKKDYSLYVLSFVRWKNFKPHEAHYHKFNFVWGITPPSSLTPHSPSPKIWGWQSCVSIQVIFFLLILAIADY